MSKVLKILLLEDEPQEIDALQNCMNNLEHFDLSGITADAAEALELIVSDCPDAVIVDLELHKGNGNGLEFLSSLQQMHLENPPFTLVTTNNSSHTIHEAARSFGADFIMLKYEPDYCAEYVANFLSMMHGINEKAPIPGTKRVSNIIPLPLRKASPNTTDSSADLRQVIQEELNLIGISPKSVGYIYLTDAILLKIQDHDANIYKELGPKYKKNDTAIERSMQYAINRAWRVSDPLDLLEHYTARIHSERGVPTIMEFIYYYATKIRNKYDLK